ncbi:MAG: hypothetical protein Q9192_006802, partial [Flavoplaca navasiana]
MDCPLSRHSPPSSPSPPRHDDSPPPPGTVSSAKAQKRIAKEAAEREELARAEEILIGGCTVGVPAHPHYGAQGAPAKGKAVVGARSLDAG